MSRCGDCQRTDVKCCITCSRSGETCGVWHHCGKDCEGYEPRIKTNFDRIKTMSVEELAEFFATLVICEVCEYCGEDKCHRTGDEFLCTTATSAKVLCKWLKSEAKE